MSPSPSTIFVLEEGASSLGSVLRERGFHVVGTGSVAALVESIADRRGCVIVCSHRAVELYGDLLGAGVSLPIVIVERANTAAPPEPPLGVVAYFHGFPATRDLLTAVERALAIDLRWFELRSRYDHLEVIWGRLKRKDHDTLDLLLAGEMNKQIAARLGITERAVEMRRASLLKRFGVSSTAELVDAAVTYRTLSATRNLTAHPGFLAFGNNGNH